MTEIKIETWDAAGDEVTLAVPARFVVCDLCEGKGSHVNPSIDGNGLSEEDFEEGGPEFREDYFRGVYDVPCHECHGLRVVMVPDEDRCTPEQMQAYLDDQESKRPCPIQEMERRMGA